MVNFAKKYKLILSLCRNIRFNFPTDKKYPTFEEFVDFITLEKGDAATEEPHWIPIEKYCNPCGIDYDIIMNTETLHEDMKLVITNIIYAILPSHHLLQFIWPTICSLDLNFNEFCTLDYNF